jgi:hypothetical protein
VRAGNISRGLRTVGLILCSSNRPLPFLGDFAMTSFVAYVSETPFYKDFTPLYTGSDFSPESSIPTPFLSRIAI